MPSFRGDSLAHTRFIELDGDGIAQPGNDVFTTCCDIDSIEWESDKEDAENVDIPNANRACRVRYRRGAIRYGYLVRIGIIGNVPELENITLGSPLNVDGGGDVIGEGSGDFVCKNTAVEFSVVAIQGACPTGEPERGWRIFPLVNQWDVNQEEAYTNENNVPVKVIEGYALKNPNFNDPFGIWKGTPSYLRAGDYTSRIVIDEPVPACSPDFTTVPEPESSSS